MFCFVLFRFLSIPKGFSYLNERGYVTKQMEKWQKVFNYQIGIFPWNSVICVSAIMLQLYLSLLCYQQILGTRAHKEDYLYVDFRIILNTCSAHLTTIPSETIWSYDGSKRRKTAGWPKQQTWRETDRWVEFKQRGALQGRKSTRSLPNNSTFGHLVWWPKTGLLNILSLNSVVTWYIAKNHII